MGPDPDLIFAIFHAISGPKTAISRPAGKPKLTILG
jgi:hypothetical protein